MAPLPDFRARVGKALIAFAGVVLVAGFGSSCNLDPVNRASVNALGDEKSDLYPPESEYHRPGEPCVLCHSKDGPASDREFVLGGTVFWGPTRYDRRVDQAFVRIRTQENTRCFVTNCNGNFYVRPDDFRNLKFPFLVSVERVKNPLGKTDDDRATLRFRAMSGHVGREPSCGNCHYLDPTGDVPRSLRDFGSPGQIRLFDSEKEVDDAKVPISKECPNELPRAIACPEDVR